MRRNNNIMRAMEIIIDKIAIWFPTGIDELTVREHPKGAMYITAKGEKEMSPRPILRYAKNYELGEHKFSLFVRTFNDNAKSVEKQLDEVAKNVTEEVVRKVYAGSSARDFMYLEDKIKEK